MSISANVNIEVYDIEYEFKRELTLEEFNFFNDFLEDLPYKIIDGSTGVEWFKPTMDYKDDIEVTFKWKYNR